MSQYDSRKVVKNIRRQTRRTYFAEENIRIVLDGLRGEARIAGPVVPGRYESKRVPALEQGVSLEAKKQRHKSHCSQTRQRPVEALVGRVHAKE